MSSPTSSSSSANNSSILSVYETHSRYYIIRSDKITKQCRILKIDRSESSELHVYEDPIAYTEQECDNILSALDAGNRGGLKHVTEAYGIAGFIKFLGPYYMLLITEREFVGDVRGHRVYKVSKTELVPIPDPLILVKDQTYNNRLECKYKKLFCSIEMSKHFYFSYSYRIMYSLQKNSLEEEINKSATSPVSESMFVWNSYLTSKFREEVKNYGLWTVDLIHGYFQQVKLPCNDDNNDIITFTLIARRSRHFAGTRFYKRGVNHEGKVANDVETEQIVYNKRTNNITSVVQYRGSIPVYWSQDASSLSPKPDINIHRDENPNYEATMLHFKDLIARYGSPIFVMNLVKTQEKKPRESILSNEFKIALAKLKDNMLADEDQIKYIQWDLHNFSKKMMCGKISLAELWEPIASKEVLDKIGFFVDNGDPKSEHPTQLQHGVLRTNCIDCLDRTNVVQYTFGMEVLCRQLHALKCIGRENDSLNVHSNSSLAIKVMEVYENMGHAISLQYGGSLAHTTIFSKLKGRSKVTIKSQKIIRSIVRYYSNSYRDGEKQDAINIFLGEFRPNDVPQDVRHVRPLHNMRKGIPKSFSTNSLQARTFLTQKEVFKTINPRFKTINVRPIDRVVTITEAEMKVYFKSFEEQEA